MYTSTRQTQGILPTEYRQPMSASFCVEDETSLMDNTNYKLDTVPKSRSRHRAHPFGTHTTVVAAAAASSGLSSQVIFLPETNLGTRNRGTWQRGSRRKTKSPKTFFGDLRLMQGLCGTLALDAAQRQSIIQTHCLLLNEQIPQSSRSNR